MTMHARTGGFLRSSCLLVLAASALAGAGGWQLSTYRGLRQNALRHLILASPDYQTS